MSVATDVTITTACHGTVPTKLTRCGVADPIVKAPTMTPRAIPRSSRYQVEIDFIAGG